MKTKKLVLGKETVRMLEKGEVKVAAGGTGHSCQSDNGCRLCQITLTEFENC